MKIRFIFILCLVLCVSLGLSIGALMYNDYEGSSFSFLDESEISDVLICNNSHFSGGKPVNEKMSMNIEDEAKIISLLKNINDARKYRGKPKTIEDINIPEGSNGMWHVETINIVLTNGKVVHIGADLNTLIIDFKRYTIDKNLYRDICDELKYLERKYYGNALDYMVIE